MKMNGETLCSDLTNFIKTRLPPLFSHCNIGWKVVSISTASEERGKLQTAGQASVSFSKSARLLNKICSAIRSTWLKEPSHFAD
jgi:hypothetical protein